MNVNVCPHFRKEEHPFIHFHDEKMRVQIERQKSTQLTDFLNPREAYIVETLVNQYPELSVQFDGGYLFAERKRAIISFATEVFFAREAFEIGIFEVCYPSKFSVLTHRKILGSLLSVGIDRSHFGDILREEARWQIFLDKSIENYVKNQVNRMGSVSVHLEERSEAEILHPKEEFVVVQKTLSSFRLDHFVSIGYNLSRTQASRHH